jgi:gliding motility-associated-like protein
VKRLGLIIGLLCLLVTVAKATHLVGGEFKYEYLGLDNNGNFRYKVNLYLFRDCLNGSSAALITDELGQFALFKTNGTRVWGDSIKFSKSEIIGAEFSNSCITNPPKVCLSRMTFDFIVTVPNNGETYTLLYQRCCRNEAENIDNPNATVVGSSYFTTFYTAVGFNNSAVFKNYPPQIICVNNPLGYDHSAIDADGDSLTYEFCNAYDLPGNISQPDPAFNIFSLNFNPVPYNPGYTSDVPIPGTPPLSIDSKTGIITGTPKMSGRYVVTVCCKEWRNGLLVAETRRDFQFVVTNCSKAVVANIPVLSQEANTYIINCEDNTVFFQNKSLGGFNYFWDFGELLNAADTSTGFQPTYTYADTGTYKVKLVVNRGSTCPDSITRIVKIYPKFKADYSYSGLLCPFSPIAFTDLSTGSLALPNYWQWIFADGTSATEQNPIHIFERNGGVFPVQLIAQNSFGCRDTATKTIDIKNVSIRATEDTIVLANTPVTLYANGATNLQWTPALYIDNPNSSTPVFIFPDTGTYSYRVTGFTVGGCVGYDSVTIKVVNDLTFVVPNVFTPNGDGLNDYAKIIQAGYGRLDYFRIFDRYGKAVFTTNSFRQFWNGSFNNQFCEQGVYYWVIKARNIKGEDKLFKGDITLLR